MGNNNMRTSTITEAGLYGVTVKTSTVPKHHGKLCPVC